MHAARRTVADTTRRLVERSYRHFWNARDFDAAPRVFGESGRFNGLLGESRPGPAGIADYARDLFAGLPDSTFEVNELIVERDRAAGRIRLRGHHKGRLLGVEATDRLVELDCAAFFRVERGRIADCEVMLDRHTLLEQIGAVAPRH